uniref:Vacuolar protein sorting 13 homolog D n=1 Tax=Sinocyclocheilus grahami TaxID=75366 RepID=A0A672L9C3_SINGR
MLEGLVAWVLNTYLGKYVSNLNTDQLSIALLKGAVELENLPLRKDALRGFDLPFEVKAGVIGKITLQIPFYRPHSDPWVICMSQLNLIIGPAPPQEYDEVREREAEREQSKSECEQKGESYWYSVTASVVTRIVENIELKIQGVHLRFEDDFSNPEKPYAFGVCIKNVSAQNCSKEPAQKLIRQKELEIGEFSVYWDTECSMLGDLPSTDVQEMMSKYMQSREHQYIFEPVCASVLVRRNASKEPLRSRNTPRIEGQVQLEPLSLRLSQVQYQQIMAFFKELDRREREMLFWKWRPKHPISGNCRQWWMFAINANLNEIREQRRQGSWDFALHRARDAKLYTSLYFQRLKGVTLSPQEECELERIEDEQTLEELQILRDTVYVSFRKHEEIAESLREPMINETPASCPSGSIPKSGSSGMIQYLQSWFPGWGGWYGGSERGPDGQPVSDDLLPGTAQWEILAETDDLFDPLEDSQTLNTFTRRDHLFARLDFILEKAAVTLYHQDKMKPLLNESGVIQLEFSGVKIGVESLPRSESSLLTVKLGGLFLRDLTTQGSIFPVLVSPKPDKVAVAISQPFGQTNSSDMESSAPPVFEMIYERNPIRSKFERRLEVNTSPLNIIYNPQAIKKVAEFFYKGRVHTSGFGYQSELELRVAEAARRQYNKLKMQTKAEIRQTIDQLLVGEFIENSKHWTMKLDICAPQVIFPDDFQSEDPMLVVVDLGRILLTNSQEDHKTSPKTSQTEGESDEEFQTPLATPPGTPPPEKEVDVKGQERPCDITSLKSTEGAQIVSKNLYEKYTLSFNDLQIMVGHYKDNWKHLQDSEVGPTHVVEKFNVLLQLEQRLRYTSDPQFPGAVLSGTLPDLKVHINLEKMTALRSCLARLGNSGADGGDEHGENLKSPDPLILRHEKIFQREDSDWKLQSSDKNLTKSVMTLEQHTREVLVESRLLLVEFNINYMQLGIESGGQYISVLKVFGTKSHFVKRPYDAMVSLTVHGLYLVDTLQTYGSDFDLLVASHKHLSFDVPTGSLRESQPTSPVSPDGKSPELPGLRRDSSDLNFDKASPRGSPLRDQEALIKLEYQFVSSDCPSMNLDRSLQVTSMQVNNLDIILNPETIVELLKFLQQSFPKDENSPTQQLPPLPNGEENEDTYQSTYVQNKELTVEIHRLNLLLLRTVTTGTVLGGEKKGMKIATASVNGTKVNVSMGSRLDVNGSLGCIQLVDLTQEGGRSQFVVSIGSVEDSSSTDGVAFFSIPGMAPSEALSFRFMEKSQGECSLQLQMASLHYNHSAKFLKELSLSANEVEDNFRSMLKTAATKVSTVLATKTAEYSGMVSLFENPYRRSRRQSQCNWTLDPFEEDYFCVPEKEPGLDSFMVKLTLDVSIESPVVSIPRKPGHPELLVGHLGSIRIQNFVTGHDSEGEKLQVEVKDIRLYSVNTSNLILRKGAQLNSSTTSGPSPSHGGNINLNEPQFTRHDFFEYLSRGKAFHILKDATIQLTVEKVPVDENLHFTFSSEEPYQSTGLMKVDGRFVNAVQVCLCKPVYEQVLQTLDNLSFIEDQRVTPSQSPTPPPPTPSSTKLHRFPDLQGGLFARDPPYVGISYSSLSSSLSATLPLQNKSPPLQPPSFTQVRAIFRVSELQVQLSGDLSQGCQGLVSLRFQDLEGDFTKDHPHSVSIQLALHSLLMEDLLEENPESKYKHLMVSRGAPKPSTFSPKEYLSQSCPTTSNVLCAEMPRSLPAQFEEAQNVFQFYQRHPSTPSASSRKSKKDAECPSTPPPSPSRHTPSPHPRPDFDDSLVHINVLMVDRRHPEFKTRYGSIGRSVDVDFNCLDILITLQTWVMILDFFGIGSTANNHAVKVPTTTPQPTPEHSLENSTLNDLGDLYTEIEERVNTKLDLKVHSLSLVLRKKSNELAKASVSKLFTHMEMIDGDLALQGSLGSLSLSDLTTHGDLYRERFTTHGGEALVYDIHKYGEPDPCLQREYDMKVSLQMASVQYVHTQRFQAEVVAFIQHFTQLQDVLGRQRAAIEGQAVRERPQRAPRVLLDIEAGAPVLLIPESSRSKRLIVANLGQLRVRNRFLPAGTRGTFSLRDKDRVKDAQSASDARKTIDKKSSSSSTMSGFTLGRPQPGLECIPEADVPSSPEDHVCLLDCIALDLQEMDIFAAERLPCEPCDSDAKHLETDLIFPSYAVRRSGERLLKERCYLKLKVERNLDKELSHAVPDMSIHGSLSSVHCSLDLERYQLIRGLLEHNLGEPVEEFLRPYNLQDPSTYTVLSGDVYTSLSLLVDMKDVSLELLDNPKSTGHNHSLARFDFMKSKLLFESFSNSSKSVNLVSHSLLAHDTRFTGSSGPTEGKRNVFDCILQPSRTGANRASLQLELHYRSTRDSSCFTVVLNNLRVFLIFDWLQLVRDFLHMPAEKGAAPTHQRWPSGSSDQGGTGAVMPRTVKSGVVTKRSTVPVTQDKYLEVKINVTGTEFVVVEDSSCLDTNAIILKGTTVLTYKPRLLDRPFSGSLAGIEVFSCRLGSEQETALSIIDPVNIQMELCGSPTYQSSSGLLDAFNIEDFPPLLEIQFPALDIRLSYNDVLLFLAIAKSIPTTGSTGPSDTATEAEISASTASTDTPSKSKDSFKQKTEALLEGQLKRLQDLGFKREDCRRALIHCKGQLDQAATWLLENAESMSGRSRTDSDSSSHSAPPLSGVEVKAESVCICFIDDCLDCDVPLAELTFSRLYVLQRIGSIKEGKASFTLSGDYYNRELSGWEPFIEPWPCFLDWQRQAAGRLHPPRLKIGVRAKQRLDVNITSVLLEQYSTTKTSWLADYCKEDEQSPQSSAALSWMGSSVDPPSFGQTDMKLSKRRQPFVPYALRNHTGCTMLFATLTTTPTRVALSHSSSADSISDVHGPGTDDTHNISQWREVLPGEEIPFEFEAREKLRHRSCDVTKITVLLDLDPGGTKQIYRQPGHTIYLLPTLVLANLLPCDLNYYIKGTSIKGTMKPGKEAVLHAADTSQNLELGVLLENFPMCKELLIPPGTQNYVVRMRLYDVNKRLICLTIRIVLRAHGALKILISASYWLVNKTGLPLIFRQDNGKTDAAGQFEEHELARSLSPLLFCYTDKEQPNMCTMRIGKGIHPDGVPGWCQGFSLDGGSGVRAVKVIQHGNRPGLIYNIGINVRKGKGRYRDTHIVTFAPRYLLDNRSSHKLAFSQREFVRGKGTANPEGYISTLPGSSVVFHWPRNDYDQLLCVRLMDVPNYTWSGGFEVNKPKSFHINMRDTLGNCFFLRAEIALKGATYQISFSDTDQLPPPFRIDNISEVPIQFWQHGVADIRLHTEVKPGAVLDYACDEPIFQPYITLTVKGAGSSEVTADMNFFREYNKLYYENFIYIAASFTFSEDAGKRPVGRKRVVSCAELVLDVETKTQRVILKKKEPGKRSQLWRMTGTGMLCHEGSSPPQSKPSQPRPLSSSLVLDIAGLAAVTDNSYEPLMLRRPDCRRSTTQTWHFSSGMLTCGLPRLVVQVRGGVSGLYDGAEVVLGPDSGVLEPLPEQQFINQKMRPGSGVLSIQVLPDGPTRVLQISDFNQRRVNRPSPSTEEDQNKESAQKKVPEEELEVLVNLEEGVGLSLVNKLPEELVFATLSGIDVHFIRTTASQVLELTVKDIQVDNQLLGTTHPVMLCVAPSSSESSAVDSGPALQVNSVKVPSSLMLTDLYKHLMVTARRYTVIIEEKLLMKLLIFFGYGQAEGEVEKLDENLYEKTNDDAGTPKRYYFENLKISLPQVKLSVFTSHKLPPDLKALKGALGFPLIRFEDAIINMYPYTRVHPYETQEMIISDILKHFKEELISQAAQILGSVDFLGNPMGLLNDVTEGMNELIKYGNVGGLIRSVTHGVSNSAAKFAGTLSDGLGKTMDNRHQTERECIRYHGATSGEHLVAGIHGLAHGIIGGLTSVITSTVEGVKTEGGVGGFFSGLGKGLVGTVTKPVAGALDFASETAQTVRDMASLSNRYFLFSTIGVAIPGPSHQKPMVHVNSESLAIKISQEINYAKSLYYEQQLMLPPSENEDSLLLDS